MGIMHKPIQKELSTSFYLSQDFLAQIKNVADFLNISRSLLVERAIYGDVKGFDNAERRIKPRKKAQKIPYKKGKCKACKQRSQARTYKQECLFNPLYY